MSSSETSFQILCLYFILMDTVQAGKNTKGNWANYN
jgi:hypothetical protein